jgi:hypothetical protein
MFFLLTTADIMAGIDQMTQDERFWAAAYLQNRAQENDPCCQVTLAERRESMEAGHKVTLEQVHRIHDALESEGLTTPQSSKRFSFAPACDLGPR